MAFAIIWQYLNGYLQAEAISRMTVPSTTEILLGVSCFLPGLLGNIYHDVLLAKLRRAEPATRRYHIPFGGMYKFISFPNYLCEWLEWSGYALCLRQPAGVSSLIFLVSKADSLGWWFVFLEICVMAPRALSGHQWYQTTFGAQYPINRKAILPFII